MIEIYTTATFDKLYLELPEKIQIKADEKAKLFQKNPFNPILRTEKLHPKGHDVWSFRIDVKNPAAETAGRPLFECLFFVSFPQAKRVGNPSGKIPDKPE
ncbi:MAG: hypothetical protein A2Y97_09110 [Nitrospirae bacterium RBG_13_39_12]|nr:MAG: hypothetical protein A2Y97_09110 [Nitrospirae bacterium RBG_13_39_12]